MCSKVKQVGAGLEHFRVKHALGLDPGVGPSRQPFGLPQDEAGSREENATKQELRAVP